MSKSDCFSKTNYLTIYTTGDDDDDEEEKEENIEFLGKAPKAKDSRVTFFRKCIIVSC